jgi:hypothetical protein
MKIKRILAVIIAIILTGCHHDTGSEVKLSASLPDSGNNISEEQIPECEATGADEIKSWQEVCAILVREYEIKGDQEVGNSISFLLYDFDKDGIPELIVVGDYNGEKIDIVYTFADGDVQSLEYEEGVSLWGYALGVRMGLRATTDNALGLITYEKGPSAGMFGISAYYQRIVIDGNRLVIDAYGAYYVDIETLHEMFDDFGYYADTDELDAAIEEHTYFLINDSAVSLEELNRMFSGGEELVRFGGTEDNIQDFIFGWEN